LNSGKITLDDVRYVDRKFHESLKKSTLQEGDVLVSRVGYTGNAALVPENFPEANCANIIIIRPKSFVNPEYLHIFINSSVGTQQNASLTAGSAQAVLNTGAIKNLVAIIPTLEEQQKIAKILRTVDNLIDKTQTLIEKYTAIKQGMMADLFIRGIDMTTGDTTNSKGGKLRPSVEDAPELYTPTELGWVPKEWEVCLLGDIADVIDPQPDHRTPPESENGIPYVGVGDFHWDQRINKAKCRDVIYEAYKKQRKRFQVELGDIIFGKIGTIGQPKQLQETEGFALSANILLIKAKEKNGYIYSFLESESFNKQLSNIVNTTSQPALGIQTMRDIKVAYPCNLVEMNAIQEKIASVQSIIVENGISLSKYKNTKKGLMQDLLTGKVSVV
jgi:type I restriction enzyme S subunit